MANVSSSRLNAAGEAVSPASYELYSVKLYTNYETDYEIRGIVTDIVVNESIFNTSIQTELTLVDGINFLEKAKLTGSEKIEIVIKRNDEKYNIECYIANIESYSKARPGVQVYKFKCVSRHAYYNTFMRLNRSFKGGIGALVKNICEKDLDTKVAKLNTDTKGIIQGIYPHLKPLDAIVWLLRNSTDNSTPFYFYETLKDGLIFDSYESMLDSEVYRKYKHKPFMDDIVSTEENYAEAQAKIIKLSSEFDVGKYFAIHDGAYASSVKTIDVATKSYKTSKFNYKKIKTLNDNKPFSDNIKFNDTTLDGLTESKIHHISLNSKAYGKLTNYHTPIADSISSKQAYHVNLGYMGQDLQVYGDFDLSVGMVVELEIYKSSDEKILEDDRKNMIDKMTSGKYLITDIAHIFDGEEYIIDMGLQKDSSATDLTDII